MFQDKMHTGIHLGANITPFRLPKSSKLLPKPDSKRHHLLIDYGYDFFVYRFWLGLGSQLGVRLRTPQPMAPHSEWLSAMHGRAIKTSRKQVWDSSLIPESAINQNEYTINNKISTPS